MFAALGAEADLVDRGVQADAEIDLAVFFLVPGRLGDDVATPACSPIVFGRWIGMPRARVTAIDLEALGSVKGLVPLNVRLGVPLMS